MSNDTYFGNDTAEKTVTFLQRKAQSWFDTLVNNSYIDKIKKSWSAYHGVYYNDAHEINFGGEQGELVNFAVNHYRNLAQHMLVMVTATRPAFQARSTNTDHKSQIQTILANGLLEFYMREKRLERHLKTAVEYAIALGSGYVKMEWNSTSGEIYDYVDPSPVFKEEEEPSKNELGEYIKDENNNYIGVSGRKLTELVDEEGNKIKKDGEPLIPYPIYEGDVQFTNLSPFDVVFDSSKETSYDHDWVLCRTFKNKHDLAAKFPELSSEIKQLATKSDNNQNRLCMSPIDETEDVPVYEFFHNRTESVPDGRYILYLNDEIILMDTVLPYRKLPIYRISAAEILGTPYGYTPMFDLLPLQDALNSLYSTVLTNQTAFGVQNVLNPRGNDVKVNQVQGSLNFIEYNAQIGKPESLNLTQTPTEIFNFMALIERQMETISGINAVARGNPESSLRSGNALALVQSQALQFISGLQQSYIQILEDVGTGLVKLLQDFAAVPRVVEISGKANKSKMQKFTGESIGSINRVIVDAGNALAQTTAGRSEMATNLIQMGLITSPEQYFSVINTGRLEGLTQGSTDEILLIKAENERLVDGDRPIFVIDTDAHAFHIREHKTVLADPDSREDQGLVIRTLTHIQEHIEKLRTVSPDLLAISGQQPLAPVGGAGVAPGNIAEQQPTASSIEQLPSETENPQTAALAGTQLPPGPLPAPAEPIAEPGTGQSLLPTNRPLG